MSRDMILPKKIFPLIMDGFGIVDILGCERRFFGNFNYEDTFYQITFSIKDMPESAKSIYGWDTVKAEISGPGDEILDEFIKHYNLHVKECGYRAFRT